jgi:hypothetical protein
MLRFVFLSNSDCFSGNRIKPGKQADAGRLIGETSFQLDNSDFSGMNFGKIKKIYPCFIRRKTANNDWRDMVFAPLDHKYNVSFESGSSLLDTEKTAIPVIDNYTSKDGLPHLYINETDELEETYVFKEDIRIGIDRDFNGKTKAGAYYKQIFYRFADRDLQFAFYADLDDFPTSENVIVSLGGDNSRFSLKAEQVQGTPKIQLPQKYVEKKNFKDCYAKIVLLSDAFLEKDAMRECMFSINETVAFRFLTSDVHTENYYKFNGSKKLQRNDKKYNLYGRGSVFYFAEEKDLSEFEAALNKERFIQIGYNNYKSIKKIKE